MQASLAAIRARLKDLRLAPIPEQGAWLNRVLLGYCNYHAVPGNLKRLDGFRAGVPSAWRQSLMRRRIRNPTAYVEVSLRFGPRVKALLNVVQGKMGCFEDNPGGGKCGETDFWPAETADRGNRATEKRCRCQSAAHQLRR